MSKYNHELENRGMWSTRFAFILAATGSAVGLGNIWRFPYAAGEYGGGAFVLIYLLCVAAIGVPIMMSEVMMGRRGRQGPVNTLRFLAKEGGKHSAWQIVGWMGILTALLILSFYSVVAGWTMAYTVYSIDGMFLGINAEGANSTFHSLIGDAWWLLFWHTLFMVLCVAIVIRGIKGGIEKAVRILMPVLFAIVAMLLFYSFSTGNFAQAVNYLFAPDFSKLSSEAILSAMGHAFFTLSLGMGAMMVYGSYLSKKASIGANSLIISGMDTLVAIMAGLAIFPIIFANGLQPEQGPGLVFKVLPIAFGAMPGGEIFGTLFFLLLVVAALTSAISLLEPIVSWLVENLHFERVYAALLAGVSVWMLGIACLLSLNEWSHITIYGKGFFDLFDFLSANILLPIGGFLIAIFSGWMLSKKVSAGELAMGKSVGGCVAFHLWRLAVRYVAPLAIAFVFWDMMT